MNVDTAAHSKLKIKYKNNLAYMEVDFLSINFVPHSPDGFYQFIA
jgi:hypothetical protein